jgi:hypothetical protein
VTTSPDAEHPAKGKQEKIAEEMGLRCVDLSLALVGAPDRRLDAMVALT